MAIDSFWWILALIADQTMHEALNQNAFISLLTLILIWICSFWIMSTNNLYPFFQNFNALCVVLAYRTTVYLISEQSSVIARNDRIIFKSPCLLILMTKKCSIAVYVCLAMRAWSFFKKDDLWQILILFFFFPSGVSPKHSRCHSSDLPQCQKSERKVPGTELIGGICRYSTIYRRTLV